MSDLRTLATRAADPRLYGSERERADLAFRAAATPAAVLALLDRVEALTRACNCAAGLVPHECSPDAAGVCSCELSP